MSGARGGVGRPAPALAALVVLLLLGSWLFWSAQRLVVADWLAEAKLSYSFSKQPMLLLDSPGGTTTALCCSPWAASDSSSVLP